MMPASSITQVCGRRPLPPHVSLNYLYLMAKQLGVIQYSGKMGNTVGRKKAGSARNIVSVKVDPSNPKTYKQAVQRAVFAAAKNFRNAFPDILNHSFQGVKYGQASLNRFTKLATLRSGDDFPNWVPQKKGSQQIIPQPWPISRGSIAAPTKLNISVDKDISIEGWKFLPIVSQATTIGEFCSALIDANPFLKNGDMLTILVLATIDGDMGDGLEAMNFIPLYDRFILDVDSETVLGSQGFMKSENGLFQVADDGVFNLQNDSFDAIFGAALIISRQNGSKASWLRSNSDMTVLTDYLSTIRTADYVEECTQTYMKSENATESDWYLNETHSGDGEGSTADPNRVRTASITVEVDGESETFANVAYVERDGQKIIPVQSATVDSQPVNVIPTKGNDTTFDYANRSKGHYYLNVSASDYQSALAAQGYTVMPRATFATQYSDYFYTGL